MQTNAEALRSSTYIRIAQFVLHGTAQFVEIRLLLLQLSETTHCLHRLVVRTARQNSTDNFSRANRTQTRRMEQKALTL
jgi:hypothetical protein